MNKHNNYRTIDLKGGASLMLPASKIDREEKDGEATVIWLNTDGHTGADAVDNVRIEDGYVTGFMGGYNQDFGEVAGYDRRRKNNA